MAAMVLITEHSEEGGTVLAAINPAFIVAVEQLPRHELGVYGAATHCVRVRGRFFAVTRADALRVIEASATISFNAPITRPPFGYEEQPTKRRAKRTTKKRAGDK